jgi:gas vesicle protein
MRVKYFAFGIVVGYACGVVTGLLIARKKYEESYEATVTDIYNQCYREVQDEMKEKAAKEFMEVKAKLIDLQKEEHSRLVEPYQKPNLTELIKARIGEDDPTVPYLNERTGEVTMRDESNEEVKPRSVEIFTEEEIRNEDFESPSTIFFYADDEIWTDEDDQMLSPEEMQAVFDSSQMEALGMIRSYGVLYLKNNHMHSNYVLQRLNSSYSEIAFETNKERERRIKKRRHG